MRAETWVVQVTLLSLARAGTINIDSSVGQELSLSCPSPPSCGPTCTWRGPHHISVTSEERTWDKQFHVSFNQSQCKCFLFIQNTSLDHSGLWTCQLRENNKQQKIHSQNTTIAMDLENMSLNRSQSSLEGLYFNQEENEEVPGWKLIDVELI